MKDVWPVTSQFLTVMMSLPNFTYADKHFDLTFSIQKFKFLRSDWKLILITTVLSFTNSLSRTSLYFSLKTSFVYSNLFSLAKTKKLEVISRSYLLFFLPQPMHAT